MVHTPKLIFTFAMSDSHSYALLHECVIGGSAIDLHDPIPNYVIFATVDMN